MESFLQKLWDSWNTWVSCFCNLRCVHSSSDPISNRKRFFSYLIFLKKIRLSEQQWKGNLYICFVFPKIVLHRRHCVCVMVTWECRNIFHQNIFQNIFPKNISKKNILQKPWVIQTSPSGLYTPDLQKNGIWINLAKKSKQFLRMEREDEIPFWKFWTVYPEKRGTCNYYCYRLQSRTYVYTSNCMVGCLLSEQSYAPPI